MEDINNLFNALDDLEQQEKSYIRDLAIADIIARLENVLGA